MRINCRRLAIYSRMNPTPNRATLGPNYAALEALAKLIARDDEVVALAVAGYTVDARTTIAQVSKSLL